MVIMFIFSSLSLVAAAEETKSIGDWLWYAATHEALQLALTFQHNVLGSYNYLLFMYRPCWEPKLEPNCGQSCRIS